MGSGWFIKSFDRARWDAMFGGGMPGAEQKILDSLLWDNDGYFDDKSDELRPGPNREQVLGSRAGRQAKALASHLARTGFTYDGLDATDSVLLDEFASRIGHPETLGTELAVKWHSPDFVPMAMISELLYRTGNVRSWWLKL